jgi:predicted AAA+ superfamily ATPase
MRREAEAHLVTWFEKRDRKPLILRGARQVGKSTLVRLWCNSQNLELIEINLEKEKIISLTEAVLDLNRVLDEIQLRKNKKINESTLIFFDEIQEQPALLSFLRYFYEERPDIAVISAGSLLEIALKSENFSFPVGRVEFYHLSPMSFKEFLWAKNQELLAEKIEQLDFGTGIESLAKESFKQYLYIGGMPKAIDVFIKEKSLVPVREVQEQILQTYLADFPKYNQRIKYERIQRVFNSCIRELGKKVIYQRFDPESQSRDIKRVLELLIDARVLIPCYHSDGNSVPLKGEIDYTIYKLYFIDVGLMNCMLRMDFETIDVQMKNEFNTKGIMAEQFVAQHLNQIMGGSIQPELFYWLRDKGSQKGEIDFLIEEGQTVVPIEVKAASAGHLKSLFYFSKQKKSKTAIRLSLQPFSKEEIKHLIEGETIHVQLLNLPIFAVQWCKSVPRSKP